MISSPEEFIGAGRVEIRQDGVSPAAWAAIGSMLLAAHADMTVLEPAAPAITEQGRQPRFADQADFFNYAKSIGMDQPQAAKSATSAFTMLVMSFKEWHRGGCKDPEFPVRFRAHPDAPVGKWDMNNVSGLDVWSLRDYVEVINLRLTAIHTLSPDIMPLSAYGRLPKTYKGSRLSVHFWHGFVKHTLGKEAAALDDLAF